MKVISNIKKADLVQLNLDLTLRTKSSYLSIFYIAVFILLYILWRNGLPDCAKDWFIVIGEAIGYSIGATLLSILIFNIYILFASNEKNGILGKHDYEITSEGFHEKTSVNEGVYKWDSFTKLRKTSSCIYLQITYHLYYLIPKRCFDSANDYEEFFNVLKDYYDEAHKG